MKFIDYIRHPWPWYVSGFAIAATMIFLILSGKTFGFSSNLRTICSLLGAGKKVKFFQYNWKQEKWNLLFLVGAVIGGFVSTWWLKSPEPLRLSPATINDLAALNIVYDGQTAPSQLFNWSHLLSAKGLFMFLGGGFLVGFGTRYAGGCTSGHAITGLSMLQVPSLIAVVGFFLGGLVMTHILFPLIF